MFNPKTDRSKAAVSKWLEGEIRDAFSGCQEMEDYLGYSVDQLEKIGIKELERRLREKRQAVQFQIIRTLTIIETHQLGEFIDMVATREKFTKYMMRLVKASEAFEAIYQDATQLKGALGEMLPERFSAVHANTAAPGNEPTYGSYLVRIKNTADEWSPWLGLGGGLQTENVQVKLVQAVEPNCSNNAVWNNLLNFVLDKCTDDRIELLRLWREGNFGQIREEWPEAPEDIFPK